jgi:hypothetical protein
MVILYGVGGRGLQIWRVAVNLLNKQSWTADKGWFSSLGVGRGVTSDLKQTSFLPNVTQGLGSKNSLERPRYRWKDNIRMDLK